MKTPNSSDALSAKPDSLRTNVRFTEQEYERIRREATILGMSIPTLLKTNYFRHKPIRVLMDAVDRRSVFAELKRIGNNLNQLARRVNSGFFEGWYPEFQHVADNLKSLERYLVGGYGLR